MNITGFFTKSLLLAAVLTLPACMTIPKGLGDYDAGFKELGVASWYGGSFHGRLTANGQVYDQFKMTAAHRLLPLGSVARVTNPENGREVEVFINDRGPFIRGRIIDLSYAAAEHLGAVYPGTLPVVVEVLQMGRRSTATGHLLGQKPEKGPGLELIVAAFLRSSELAGETSWLRTVGSQSAVGSRGPLDVLRDPRRPRRVSDTAMNPEEMTPEDHAESVHEEIIAGVFA
ncbi:MAG TPA: septal ring lytic transglycosylase RlpA family protein [Nitrospirales bacterium]|nr:septal ring lytic transglycosylase RlpA family protein [Nitrospirales bacterium]